MNPRPTLYLLLCCFLLPACGAGSGATETTSALISGSNGTATSSSDGSDSGENPGGLTPANCGSASIYEPAWAALSAVQINHYYDSNAAPEQNAALLAQQIANLNPGERLVVEGGLYRFTGTLAINLQGNSSQPIWIVGQSGNPPVLTRTDASTSIVDIGALPPVAAAQYLVFCGFELTGGGKGLRLQFAHHVWATDLHVHHTGGAGISANTAHTSFLSITDNEVNDTASWGEGIILGSNSPNFITHHSTIAGNHVHHTQNTSDGSGIKLRYGSYANWVFENYVHHTKFPCIFFENNNGLTPNLIERNVAHDSLDNIFQAQGGDAIVQNNLIMGRPGNKTFDASHDPARLVAVHNTIFNSQGYGVGLNWNGQPGNVFANNVVVVNNVGNSGYSIAITAGGSGVGIIANNVVYGNLDVPLGSNINLASWSGIFANVSSWSYAFTGDVLDFAPGGAIIGSGSALYDVADDLTGALRTGTIDAGALDKPN